MLDEEMIKLAQELNNMIDENYSKEDSLRKRKFSLYRSLNEANKFSDIREEKELQVQLDQLNQEEVLLFKQREDIWRRQDDLKKKVYFSKPPAGWNEKVDLRTKDDMNYEIYLHDTDTLVGKVEYRGYHVSEYLGDVGGFVEEEYRGNHYIYEALCVLGDILEAQGINDFWVTTFEENTPSKKSIERYGGHLLSSKTNPPGVLLYECPTKKKEFGVKK